MSVASQAAGVSGSAGETSAAAGRAGPQPAGVRDRLRGGPAGRPAERVDRRAGRGQGRVRAPPRRGRAGDRRDHVVRRPAVGAPARRRRGAARPARRGGAGARSGPVLVPNERGLERALAAGVGAVAIFGSATETFARRNLNRTVDESVEMFRPVVERSRAEGLWVRAYVSMCFGDPWEGPVPVAQVVDVCRRLMDLGCDQLSLGDTIGVGTTGHVHRAARGARRRGHRPGPGRGALPRHLRAGAGQHHGGPAGRRAGGRRLDRWPRRLPLRQVGHRQPRDRGPRLGARGRGRLDTGIDLDALVATSAWMAGQLGRPSPSRVVRALDRRRLERRDRHCADM